MLQSKKSQTKTPKQILFVSNKTCPNVCTSFWGHHKLENEIDMNKIVLTTNPESYSPTISIRIGRSDQALIKGYPWVTVSKTKAFSQI